MIMSIGTYVRRGQRFLRRWTSDPKLRSVAKGALYALCGFALSAASLGNAAQPLPLSLLCAGLTGVPSMLVALGSTAGYFLLWGSAGTQGLIWICAGLVLSFALGSQKVNRAMPLLMPALAGLSVAATGLMFLAFGNDIARLFR